ncbi:MAG: EpsG family protein [Bacteroidaceae bacterium]|nr:EpsG family protein [Bacteroidaceae bacterium]
MQIYEYSVSYSQVILSALLWLFAFYICKRQTAIYNSIEEADTTILYKPFGFLLVFGILVFCYSTFGCSGSDFLHYWDLYNKNAKSDEPIHYEQFYYEIIHLLPDGYYWWRAAVWGTATCALMAIIHRLRTDADISCLIFVLLLMFHFPNLRQVLGFTVMYYGFILLYESIEEKREILLPISICFIALSTIFHSTMTLFIVLTLLPIIPGVKNKYVIITLLLLFPILYISFSQAKNYLLIWAGEEYGGIERATHYIGSDFRSSANLFGLLKMVINRFPILALLSYSMWHVFFKRVETSMLCKNFLMASFLMIYLSFLFENNDVSSFLSTRLWDAAIYPLAFFSMVFLRDYITTRFVKYALLCVLFSNLYNLAYVIYSVNRMNAEYLISL